jgi:phage head maturation protease
MKGTTVAIKSVFRDQTTISGWAVVFGGRDLMGDTFSSRTDFGLERKASNMPLFYEHAQHHPAHQLGRVLVMHTKGGKGVYFEANLNRRTPFVEEVLELIAQKALGVSTGSAAHLVRRSAGEIVYWPIIEVSLTVAPAEPRTSGLLVSG